jgi:hypothetical protein
LKGLMMASIFFILGVLHPAGLGLSTVKHEPCQAGAVRGPDLSPFRIFRQRQHRAKRDCVPNGRQPMTEICASDEIGGRHA